MNPWTIFVLLVVGLIALVFIIIMANFFSLWLRALLSGAHVSFLTLIGMRLRKVSPSVIVQARIMGVKAGLEVETDRLEAHYLAGGNVMRVATALIAGTKANLGLGLEKACIIDLAGRDVLDAVRASVTPKVIDCPDPRKGRATIDAVAKDGIQLKAKARVTVRTNIDKLIGGATEETIIARVGEGIVTTIGSAATFKDVLENPDQISRTVMGKGLDAGTAYRILSIDVADVDVGENVGAKLQAEQAEADSRRFQAKAEELRAQMVAREQEMKAEAQKNRALVILAEAEIPKAIAQAFREGNLGLLDYYKLKNIQADTDMRDSISKIGGKGA
jgi:uncharacterized protein YqfA (UPF0365 family)